jgi:hypothetical protein
MFSTQRNHNHNITASKRDKWGSSICRQNIITLVTLAAEHSPVRYGIYFSSNLSSARKYENISVLRECLLSNCGRRSEKTA